MSSNRSSSRQKFAAHVRVSSVNDVSYEQTTTNGSGEAVNTILSERKCWRVMRDKDEVVWPPALEAALIEGKISTRSSTCNSSPFQKVLRITFPPSRSLRGAWAASPCETNSSRNTSSRKQARPGHRSRWAAASSNSGTQMRVKTVSLVPLSTTSRMTN